MRETLIKHQVIEYQRNEPFFVANTTIKYSDDLYVRNSHWHEELELFYVIHGNTRHFIDGEVFMLESGQILVTNCESVHRIEVLDGWEDLTRISGVVLIIHNRFLEENFPEYQDFRFTNENPQACPEVRDIMLQFSRFAAQKTHREHEHLYMRGLLLQLLYYLCQAGTVCRTDVGSLRRQEQVQTLKEILQYVEEHYREPMTQSAVAREFYFTPQYFARYFKQCTGTTFIEHLTAYRIARARQELLRTDHRISDIARNNGFHDDRSFINAFKRTYGVTPLQYRKSAARFF